MRDSRSVGEILLTTNTAGLVVGSWWLIVRQARTTNHQLIFTSCRVLVNFVPPRRWALCLRDHAVRRVGMQVGFLAVEADIEAADLVGSGRTERNHQSNEFHKDEAGDEAVDRSARDGHRLNAELARISVQQPVLHGVERL